MAEAYGPAPPINLSTLLPQINRYCLSAGQTADLALDTQFVNARSRAHQMGFSPTELHLNLSIRSVARAFNIAHCLQSRGVSAAFSRSTLSIRCAGECAFAIGIARSVGRALAH
jgi:hypothetical protein